MSVLDLAPHLGLPVDLNADSLRGLLDAKRGGLLPAVRGLQRGAPLADQPSGCEEALAGQGSPLHTGQVPAAETHQPAADDVAHAGRLGLGQEATVVEGRLDGNAGPDLGLEVGDDGPGRFLLRLAERAPVGGLVASCRRPAQQCVGVEVPEYRVDDRSADRAAGGVIGGQVDRTAHQAPRAYASCGLERGMRTISLVVGCRSPRVSRWTSPLALAAAPEPELLFSPDRSSCARLSISACFLRLVMRASSPVLRSLAMGLGGSGGGPLPDTG
ncbi:hypothetical protein PoMZ_12933 [Pyricularia oryzae]|uniref:Uncharacterized protein n=1 Tax=Pyricularia oryzae TaxID=318829 RepID=A0A4P7NVK3_PYROR|nr:hypothetical protein PoMZ_12933 [Pyricularia oryzae]